MNYIIIQISCIFILKQLKRRYPPLELLTLRIPEIWIMECKKLPNSMSETKQQQIPMASRSLCFEISEIFESQKCSLDKYKTCETHYRSKIDN